VTHYQPPPRLPPSREAVDADETLRRDRLKREMGGGNILVELWMIVKFVATLPWRGFKWVGSKVAPVERADRI
jgi:hypothetical protein